ncbi:origin recognition complex subunit [Niveomyces insectorum RCEF 264]|uniref:Origin recognition complex subunit n=1 Tax=Niveomyces insectorum RCEF 264 TaxID=1081102 RepID=A0A167WEF2_9HYPO|nr:origin recognition complex subunit [Niveomyces insectorum RCEF 264]
MKGPDTTGPPSGDSGDTSIVQRVAYIYSPSDDEDIDEQEDASASATPSRRSRKLRAADDSPVAAKKRRTTKGMTVNGGGGGGGGGGDVDGDGDGFDGDDALAAFSPLLQGREPPDAVARRWKLFTSTWAELDNRIQTVLQRANQATLQAILDFIETSDGPKLPAAFVVFGPAAATTDLLLFKQLGAALVACGDSGEGGNGGARAFRRMVRLRAAEAPNLRAALKTIVRGATEVTATGDAADDDDVVAKDGHKYLAYDLEAVYVMIRDAQSKNNNVATPTSTRIVLVFEDSEAFDAALLADLLAFLHAWRDRIPFVLLFGVATSVDLFHARLPKQAAHRLAASPSHSCFDVAPSAAVLDRLVRRAVAAADVPLRLGPNLLRTMAERQDEQVAGISVFSDSLKYAYMCYFYANPLSVLVQGEDETIAVYLDNPDYDQAVRQLPSFRRHVEALVAAGEMDAAKTLLLSSASGALHLRTAVCRKLRHRRRWTTRLVRALHLATTSGIFSGHSFTELYISALADGTGFRKQDSRDHRPDKDTASIATTLLDGIRRMSATELVALARRLAAAVRAGDTDLALAPADDTAGDDSDDEGVDDTWRALAPQLSRVADDVEALQRKVEAQHLAGNRKMIRSGGPPVLRSKYSAQSKVLRTTVVAQKVQLSRDAAALTDDDQAFTVLVDAVVDLLASHLDVEPAASTAASTSTPTTPKDLWLQEIWLYDARTPYREVFVPRPGLVFERALSRPHDYLACACCGDDDSKTKKKQTSRNGKGSGSIRPTLPPTAILYQLYLEAGPLINVADLWAAFQTVVAENDKDKHKKDDDSDEDNDDDEQDEDDEEKDTRQRLHLVQFYEALAELKALGFIKATRRKVDHVAKVKWL